MPAPGRHNPPAALEYEIAQEMASALGRLGRTLEAALAELAAFDAAHQADGTPDRKTRAQLVAAAGHALWCFIVQRESCGLRDSRLVLRDYRVPAEVSDRMGVFPPVAIPRRRR
jgi:hypothetical protein